MSSESFNKVMRGLKEAQAFAKGEREGSKVTTCGPITSRPKVNSKADLAKLPLESDLNTA